MLVTKSSTPSGGGSEKNFPAISFSFLFGSLFTEQNENEHAALPLLKALASKAPVRSLATATFSPA